MTFEIIETPLSLPSHQISRVARQINVITENDWAEQQVLVNTNNEKVKLNLVGGKH